METFFVNDTWMIGDRMEKMKGDKETFWGNIGGNKQRTAQQLLRGPFNLFAAPAGIEAAAEGWLIPFWLA